MQTCPSNPPKKLCIVRDNKNIGRPIQSSPIELIFTAFFKRRLPFPPLTKTRNSFWRLKTSPCL